MGRRQTNGQDPASPHQAAPLAVAEMLTADIFFELAPDAVVVCDEQGRMERVNRQTETLFGYARAELSDQPIEMLIPSRFHARHTVHRQHYVAQPRARPMGAGLELYGLRKDGSEFPVEISLSPVTTLDHPRVIASIRDVSEQRALERRTRDSLSTLLAMARALIRLPRDAGQSDVSHVQPAGLAQRLAELVSTLLDCRYVGILRLDRAKQPDEAETDGSAHLYSLAVVGLSHVQEQQWRTALDGMMFESYVPDPAQRARLWRGEPVTLDLAQPHLNELPRLAEEFTRLLVPMRVGSGQLIGLVVVSYTDSARLASQADTELALATAQLLALVIEWDRLLAERQTHRETEAHLSILQAVLDELPTGIYLVRGYDARLVLANRAAADVWGAGWPVGQPMMDFLDRAAVQIYGPDGHLLTHESLATVLAVSAGDTIRQHQEVIRRPDGTTLPILLSAVPLDSKIFGASEASGTEIGQMEPAALVVLQDVSALKEAERLKDEFVALAAHELRNPMAPLKGYADMLLRKAGAESREQRAELRETEYEAVAAISEATTRLVELTDDLLDVTRLQAGQMHLVREPHDLLALVRRVTRRLQVTAPHHDMRVRCDEAHVMAAIDQQRMEQVISNLLHNAVKYSPDGGDIEIILVMDRDRQQVEMRVQDHGIGIPVAEQSRIFGRFARADNVRVRGITGTGLGLFLCREFVKLHNGAIWLESLEGHGTTFHVTLPLIPES